MTLYGREAWHVVQSSLSGPSHAEQLAWHLVRVRVRVGVRDRVGLGLVLGLRVGGKGWG